MASFRQFGTIVGQDGRELNETNTLSANSYSFWKCVTISQTCLYNKLKKHAN